MGSDTHRLRLGGRGGKPEAEADPLMDDRVAGLATPLICSGGFAFWVAAKAKRGRNGGQPMKGEIFLFTRKGLLGSGLFRVRFSGCG